jgi:hypothetical protein
MKLLIFLVFASLISISFQKEYVMCGCHQVSYEEGSFFGYENCIHYSVSTLNQEGCHDLSTFYLQFDSCPEDTNKRREDPTIQIFGDCVTNTDDHFDDKFCHTDKSYTHTDLADCKSKDLPVDFYVCTTGYNKDQLTDLQLKSGTGCDDCKVPGFCAPSTVVVGDPHVSGFKGQNFDFDGKKGKFYNFLSTNDIQLNMYLDNFKGNSYDQTFIEKVGIKTRDHQLEISTKHFGGIVKLDGEDIDTETKVEISKEFMLNILFLKIKPLFSTMLVFQARCSNTTLTTKSKSLLIISDSLSML